MELQAEEYDGSVVTWADPQICQDDVFGGVNFFDWIEIDSPGNLVISAGGNIASWLNCGYIEYSGLFAPASIATNYNFSIRSALRITQLYPTVQYDIEIFAVRYWVSPYYMGSVEIRCLSAGQYRLGVRMMIGAGIYISDQFVYHTYTSLPINRYIIFRRSGTTLTLLIYTDAGFTELEDTLTVSNVGFVPPYFNELHIASYIDSSPTGVISFQIENMFIIPE